MYRTLNLNEDLALKQVVTERFSLTDRGFAWREVLSSEKRGPTTDITITRGATDTQFSLEDVADAIGDSLADLLISRSQDEKSIFSDVNRQFVSDVAHTVAASLTASLRRDGRLRLSEADLYLLIEKALVENEAHDVAKSLAFRRSMEKTGTVDLHTSPSSLPVRLIRRNGNVVPWSETKIEIAVRKAFLTIKENPEPAIDIAKGVTDRIRSGDSSFVHIEDVQDMVQEELMSQGHFKVATHYIRYRDERARLRQEQEKNAEDPNQELMVTVISDEGLSSFWDGSDLRKRIAFGSIGLDLNLNEAEIERELRRSVGNEISAKDLKNTVILNAKTLIEKDADFAKFAARILLSYIYEEVLDWSILRDGIDKLKNAHKAAFKSYLKYGVSIKRLTPELLDLYDLDKIADAFDPTADLDFDYLGIQTLYDRYLIVDKTGDKHRRIETPQFFWMRVAMGLFKKEQTDRENWAIRLYNLYKGRRFCSSTPTLFNSGTLHSQLSSCYLYKVDDSIESIMYRGIAENAFLSKWAGGLGGSWTAVRGTGGYIQGTNGESQGIIPFLKLHNDQLVAVNQGGKRRGSGCAYLETWHNDIEDFLDLRKNTGDERRRCHDMNTANWVPDLFMKRMEERGTWTLFRSNEVPDLHDLYGSAFERRYCEYEQIAATGKIWSRQLPALELWKSMLKMVFETGHPWITFKDPCNVRSPQDHCGVIHSSNLCCMTADQRIVTSEGIVTVAYLYNKSLKQAKVRAVAGGGEEGDQEIANTVLSRDTGHVSAGPMLMPRPDAPIVRIHTREGYTHKVTPDHKVWVVDQGWVEAQKLVKGDKIALQNQEGIWGTESRKDEAFLCGLIAGDGTFMVREGNTTALIDLWTNEFSAIPEIEAMVHRLIASEPLRTSSKAEPKFTGDEYKQRLASAPLAKVLARLGFTAETKLRIPEFVWNGTRETAAAYLRGLYLADATVQADGDITTCSVATKDRAFVEELQILLTNFGIKTFINQMREAGTALMPDGHGGEKEYFQAALYRLLVTSIQGCRIVENITGIGAARGNARFLSNLEKQGYVQKFEATFEALEILENEDAYCLQVFTEEHSWIANGIVTKNTEITLNTSDEETAVCNLGSVVLDTHITRDGALDHEMLKETITVAIRALDNVIDINFYPTEAARTANTRHRPIGLGVMGVQNALYKRNLAFASDAAVEFNDEFMEAIAYYAYNASSDLASEVGTYSSYKGSKWDRGLLPQDTVDLLETERGRKIDVPRGGKMDWSHVREKIAKHGMRNSNVLAIAPTATISNIMGTTPCIEPNYKNLYVKSNLSGDFIVLNSELVKDLKKAKLWNQEMLDQLKYFDGELDAISDIPEALKHKHKTVFGIDFEYIIDAAARRQKWIDQAQSVNLFLATPEMKTLSHMYRRAWDKGLKTTYYLRTLQASNIEKSTIDVKKEQRGVMATATAAREFSDAEKNACSIDAMLNGESCEACQ